MSICDIGSGEGATENLKREVKELINGLQIYQRAIRAYRFKHGMEPDAIFRPDANREARRILRVGVKIASKVEEFIKSGKMESAQRGWYEETCGNIQALSKVEGLGPLRAAELVDAGITNIDDLYCNTDKLTRQQIIGLEHYNDFSLKIPLSEANSIVEIIQRQVSHMNHSYSVYLCGAFRRGAQVDDVIDCVIKKSDDRDVSLKQIINRLEGCGLITDTICLGECKFSGVCKFSPQTPVRRLSILLTPASQFPFALLFHTGPRNFIDKILKKANEEALTLTEYSLQRNLPDGFPGDLIPVSTEEEIFEHIKLPFVIPEIRK